MTSCSWLALHIPLYLVEALAEKCRWKMCGSSINVLDRMGESHTERIPSTVVP